MKHLKDENGTVNLRNLRVFEHTATEMLKICKEYVFLTKSPKRFESIQKDSQARDLGCTKFEHCKKHGTFFEILDEVTTKFQGTYYF